MGATPQHSPQRGRLALASIGLLLVGCASGGEREIERCEPRALEHGLKGWELYALHSRCLGTWSFALLPGTNRVKTDGEIWAAALSQDDLLRTIERLPAGETVNWRSFPSWGQTPEPLPPLLVDRIHGAVVGRGGTLNGMPGPAGVR